MNAVAQITLATFISSLYVVILRIFDFNGIDRNDSRSIRRRFSGAIFSNIISMALTYYMLSSDHEHPFALMGIHMRGTLMACFLPAVLTSVCYLGTWVVICVDGSIWALFDLYEWKQNVRSLTWIRDTIVAPITEEIAFRACAATLISQSFSLVATIFIAPLPFALSHLHHVADDLRRGCTKCEATVKRVFQMLYSYAFGAYATFLFMRTGSVLPPIVSHSICNNMGLPLIHEICNQSKSSIRTILWLSYVVGFVVWLSLLLPFTEPKLYT